MTGSRMKNKLRELRKMLREMGSVLVAFSGGVDSAFLMKVAQEELGDKALAVTLTCAMFTPWEMAEAEKLARENNFRHEKLPVDALSINEITANPVDRCYHCKKAIFRQILERARSEGIGHVVEGTNASDLGDYRPGRKALGELGILSPLLEAGLTKPEIRELSKGLGLESWDRPSCACLASRIPYGVEITEERLEQIGRAEEFLRGMGIVQCRARYHWNLLRIETCDEYIDIIVANRANIVNEIRNLGFDYVALDLEGYRTGSMNVNIEKDDE
ncbi:MAG: ATP-dependent sacrificial sulfur transferase LarE [Planctomycetes bacterium]|nr:ATP-dependent sacrificial sulfur transferase LarE [Planctomycetota bacterium]